MEKAKELAQAMTLQEKILQLVQISLGCYRGVDDVEATGPVSGKDIVPQTKYGAGSVIGFSDPGKVRAARQEYCENNRFGLPPLVMADVIHGYKTIFPLPLAMSCTWSAHDLRTACRIAAQEAVAGGIDVTFAPMADLVRDPRWGRVMESSGEDPYLNALFAEAAVLGFHEGGLACCVKHFAGYSAPEGGREYNTVDLSLGMLREFYLSGYHAAVKAGCDMVMTAFSTLDRVPCTCSPLLERILRRDWGFAGPIISDWGAVEELMAHGVAADTAQAAEKALLAGVDIDMMTDCYLRELPELARSRPDLCRAVEESALRVLRLKEARGLLEPAAPAAEAEFLSAESRQAAREIAGHSIVLLKNQDGCLPLAPRCRVGLAGTLAATNALLGGWSARGENRDCVTLEQGLREAGVTVRMLCPDGGDAAGCDVVLLVTGEPQEQTGEAASKTSLRLPEQDLQLLHALQRQGVPIVTLVYSGRPMLLEEAARDSHALVQAWYLGTESGHALADLLLGRIEPQGRLTMSFPRTEGQIPVYYNHYRTGRPYGGEVPAPRYVSRYLDCPNEPLFPFGFGLSYTQVAYRELTLSAPQLRPGDTLQAVVRLQNIGARPCVETVQLYIRDHCGSVVRPVLQLKDFRQVRLQPGQEAEVSFAIRSEMLCYPGADGTPVLEPGRFSVLAGPDSVRLLQQDFTLISQTGGDSL